MGEYRYAVVELPPSPYAHDLQEVLAFVFDIGVNLSLIHISAPTRPY